jgi:hypothetical protein
MAFAMLRVLGLFVAAAAAHALATPAGPVLVRALLGLPREFCPVGPISWAMTGSYFAILGLMVAGASLVLWRPRPPAGRTMCVTAAGAVAASAVFIVVMYLPPVTSLIVASARRQAGVHDALRWSQALLTAAGAVVGAVVARRSPTRR